MESQSRHTVVYLETQDKDIERFPQKLNEKDWQEFLSKLAYIRIKMIYREGQTLQCTFVQTTTKRDETHGGFVTQPHVGETFYKPEDDYLLKFEVEKNFVVYLTLKPDLDGSQLEGKELVCICLSYRPRYGFTNRIPMLVVRENTEGLAERVGCCKFRKTYVQIDQK